MLDYKLYLKASNGNGEAVRANVVAERPVGITEINVDSVLNWPDKFVATSGIIDPATGTFEAGTVTVFFGHLSGTYIIIDEYAPGYSDIGNNANEIIVLKPTTPWSDKVAEAVADSGSVWGSITGTLADQTDLQTALDALQTDIDDKTANLVPNTRTINGVPLTSDITIVALPDQTGASDKYLKSNGITAGWNTLPNLANQTYDEPMAGTVNGTNKVFTTAANFASILVFKNGLTLHVGDDYTITGANQITFVTAPATGTKITALYNTAATAMINGSNSLKFDETPAGLVNGVNLVFTTSVAYVANSLEVFINGIKQKRNIHFTETTPGSGIFTMSDAPITDDDVMVCYQFVSSVSGNADTLDSFHANATPTANSVPVLDSTARLPVLARTLLGFCSYFGYLSSNQTTTSTTPVAISTISSNITTKGGALLLMLTLPVGVSGQTSSGGLYINGVFYQLIIAQTNSNLPQTGFLTIAAGVVPAGTYAVTPRFYSQSSGVTSTIYQYSTISFSVVEI